MKLTNLSVHRPVGVLIIVIAVMILGVVSLMGLSIDLIPDIELPIAAVMTNYSGAAPPEVENLVTDPIEGSVSTVEGLDTIQSISAPGQSVILLMYDFGTDIDNAMLDLRDRIDMIREALPDGAADPMVIKFDPEMMPVMQVGFSGDVDMAQLSEVAEETIQPRLERLSGVGQVDLIGLETEQINVEVDPAKLETYQLSLHDLTQMIGAENMDASAGDIQRGSQELSLRVIGEFDDLDDIRNINIPLQTGETIKLHEIANVTEAVEEVQSYAYVNGEPSLSLNITQQTDSNTVDVANTVHDELVQLEEDIPEGMHLNTVMDMSEFIEEAIDSVVLNMIIGGVLAVLILLVFLRSFRSTLVIGISIPIAIISAFTLIYFSGETLNILTLGGLALGIGLMVDSSIIILENIYKYRERGYSLIDAAKQGTAEIGSAVIAATLTSAIVFLPMIFTDGIAAEIFMPLAMTVAFTLLASLVVALTLVPMLSSRLLPPLSDEEQPGFLRRLANRIGRGLERLKNGYQRVLQWSINHRKTIFFTTLVLLIGSLLLIPFIGVEFLPMVDQGEILISVDMPSGTNMDATGEVVEDLEHHLQDIPGIDIIFSTLGSDMSGMGGGAGNIGSIYTKLVPQDEREITTQEIIDDVNDYATKIPDANIQATPLQSAEMGGEAISINLSGDDLDTLRMITQQIEEIMDPIEGVANVNNSMDETRGEIQVHVDRDEAEAYGLSYLEVMQTVESAFLGSTATMFRSEGQETEVAVIYPEEYRQTVEDLENLSLQTPLGDTVSLSTVAEVVEDEGPNVINRQDRERGVSISADVFERDLGSVMADIETELETLHLPDGYDISFGGQFELMVDAFTDLALALVLGIFLVYAVMAIQFEKVMYPLIIMFSMPLTIIGIMIGLTLTGHPLSAPGFIGIIILSGIVVNNAIVLVDYINTLRERGHEREEAIVLAGPDRLRPILMTMLTTVLAMTPMAMGIGEGAELQAPMAVVVVFGLSFSTLITLIFVPVMYIYMDNLTNWVKSKFRRDNRVSSELE